MATVICAPGYLSAQDEPVERDSSLHRDSMVLAHHADTSDFLDGNVQMDSNSILASGIEQEHNYLRCHDFMNGMADHDMYLCPTDPTILIYNDPFKTLNKGMWLHRSWNQTHAAPCPEDPRSQAINLSSNVSLNPNGYLSLLTKKEPYTLGARTFDFQSARVEFKYAFESNVIIEARLRVPTQNGCFPAFWLMGFEIGDYDELDIFEFFRSQFDEMCTALHKGSSGIKDDCKDCSKIWGPWEKDAFGVQHRYILDVSEFHTYTLIWDDFAISVFVDGRLFYIKHHFARQNRVGEFQCHIPKGENYRKRRIYPDNAMRTNFNTNVNCANAGYGPVADNFVPVTYDVDYVNVYKKFKCNQDIVINDRSDYPRQPEVFNVMVGRKVTIDFTKPGTLADPDIPSNEILKIISNDIIEVKKMTVDPKGTLILQSTEQDLCVDQYTGNRRLDPMPPPTHTTNADDNRQSSKPKFGEEISISRDGTDLKVMDRNAGDNRKGMLRVYNVSGQLVYSGSLFFTDNRAVIDISNLQCGVYFVHIQDEHHRPVKAEKVVICNE